MAGFARDVLVSLAFLTRIPVRRHGAETPDFRTAARAFPVAGAAVGAAGGLVLLVSAGLDMPPLVGAVLAVLATFAVSGGLHEDGLADTADGFWGGATPARKLEIMRDSRIGTYGAAAVAFSILIRAAALAALAGRSPAAAALALVTAEAASRAAMVALWRGLPAAADGLAARTGPPTAGAVATALAVAAAAAGLAALAGLHPVPVGAGILAAGAAAFAFARIAARQIGGRTGDTLGACQQVTVCAFLAGATVGA